MSLIFLQDHRTDIEVLLKSTPGATEAFFIVNVHSELTNPFMFKIGFTFPYLSLYGICACIYRSTLERFDCINVIFDIFVFTFIIFQ